MNRCQSCGILSEAAPETCPACGAFAMMLAILEEPPPAPAPAMSVEASEVEDLVDRSVASGIAPWDELLGGGLHLGSTLVLYGPAGGRKTTWMGAVADAVGTRLRRPALYLSAEMTASLVVESVRRVRAPLRALRIVGLEHDASSLERCLAEVARVRPAVVVYDSIQNFDAGGSFAGSELAVTATVRAARRAAATLHHAAVLISQVNKAGLPAGPYKTIHDCDQVARLEERSVRTTKNRHFPLAELAIT